MSPDDLAHILDDLGKRLGPTGEYVFGLAVRQVYINAVTYGLIGLALIVAGGFALYRAPKSDYVEQPLVTMLGGFLALVGVGFIAFSIPPVLNPEYAAIRDILGAIGNGS